MMSQRVLAGLLVLASLGVLMASLPIASAPASPVTVVANFTGGNGDTVPDAYVGTAGDGWTGAWGQANYQNGAVSGTVLNSVELTAGGGNYLETTVTRGDSDTFYGCVGRTYNAGIDTASDHTIRFKYRIDTDVSTSSPTFADPANDGYDIFGYSSVYRSTTSSNPWQILGRPGDFMGTRWKVCNGTDTNVDTGMTLEQGVVYDFQINVRPWTRTWDVRIENLTTSAVYNSTDWYPTGLAFRGANTASTLNFHARGTDATDVRKFSVDQISITGVDSTPYGGLTTVAAHFSGGNSDAVVDGYAGKAGDGWKMPWGAISGYSPISPAPTVLSAGDPGFSQIKPGLGSYLHAEADGEGSTSSAYQGVGRDYRANAAPGIDWTKPHSVQFTVRIDENVDDPSLFLGSEDRYAIFDREAIAGATDSHFRWGVIGHGKDTTGTLPSEIAGEWTFYDGDRTGAWNLSYNMNTDVALHTGHVYDFKIVVDPTDQTYDATVADVTDAENPVSCTLYHLGWRSTATEVGGVVNFTARDDYHTSGDARAFSLDEVIITQIELPKIPGDTDGNQIVDAADAEKLAANWGKTVSDGAADGDFNGDKVVNAADASILAANWGNHTGQESTPGVPEPSAFVLLVGVGLALVARRRR